jgi:hypothetical protein
MGYLLTIFEKWTLVALRAESLTDGLSLIAAISISTALAGYLVLNLFGAAVSLILPYNVLKKWEQKLERYPITMWILRRAVSRQLRKRYGEH